MRAAGLIALTLLTSACTQAGASGQSAAAAPAAVESVAAPVPAGVAPVAAAVATPAPADGVPVEMGLVGALLCQRRPEPTPILIALHRGGYIVPAPDSTTDSVSCFGVRRPLNLPNGPRVVAVCAFDEDYRQTTAGTEYTGLYSRGPGTSPGQIFSVMVEGMEADARRWATANGVDPGVTIGASVWRTGSDLDPANSAEISCNRIR